MEAYSETAVAFGALPTTEPVRKWTPLRTALFLTAGLRLFYSIFAAAFSPYLTSSPALIATRSYLTEHLMQREGLNLFLLRVYLDWSLVI